MYMYVCLSYLCVQIELGDIDRIIARPPASVHCWLYSFIENDLFDWQWRPYGCPCVSALVLEVVANVAYVLCIQWFTTHTNVEGTKTYHQPLHKNHVHSTHTHTKCPVPRNGMDTKHKSIFSLWERGRWTYHQKHSDIIILKVTSWCRELELEIHWHIRLWFARGHTCKNDNVTLIPKRYATASPQTNGDGTNSRPKGYPLNMLYIGYSK